jgi:hypothetical protein
MHDSIFQKIVLPTLATVIIGTPVKCRLARRKRDPSANRSLSRAFGGGYKVIDNA